MGFRTVNKHVTDNAKRTARLFRNGRSQAVRIPKEFEFDGDEVTMFRDDQDRLVLEQSASPKIRTVGELLAWIRQNGPIEDFPRDPGDDDLLPLDEPDI